MSKLDSYQKVELYRRYRDDCFLLWNETNKGEVEELLEDFNTLDDRIKFTMEVEEEGALPFLDALITRKNGSFVYRVYTKPYASGNLLNFNSFHDVKVKRSLIIGETIRRGRISDKKEEDWELLRQTLIKNAYPPRFIENNMNIGKRSLKTKPHTQEK